MIALCESLDVAALLSAVRMDVVELGNHLRNSHCAIEYRRDDRPAVEMLELSLVAMDQFFFCCRGGSVRSRMRRRRDLPRFKRLDHIAEQDSTASGWVGSRPNISVLWQD